MITGELFFSLFLFLNNSCPPIAGLALLYSAVLLITPPVRRELLRARAAQQGRVLQALDQIHRFLHVGDWKVFYILGINMEPLVFGELMVEFSEQLEDTFRNIAGQQVTQI